MSQERKIPPPEVVEWFAASEELYHATLAEIAAGTSLPDDAESASHIAFSVAMESFKWGAPCPARAADCVLSDWRRFEDFKRSEEHKSELQALMRISYAVFCLKKKKESYKHNQI